MRYIGWFMAALLIAAAAAVTMLVVPPFVPHDIGTSLVDVADIPAIDTAAIPRREPLASTESAATPLVVKKTEPERSGTAQNAPAGTGALSPLGILVHTNTARALEGKEPLTGNVLLDAVAKARVDDMFKEQYFEHISPRGVGAGDVAKEKGYAYLRIGENIALGMFRSAEELVDAWMESPGHRANIVSGAFEEIGIAAQQGMFEGSNVWIAAQIFALPMSACPEPDAALLAEIERAKERLEALKAIMDAARAEIETMQPKTKQEYALYNERVREYNEMVAEWNALAGETEKNVARYNVGVAALNACAETAGE